MAKNRGRKRTKFFRSRMTTEDGQTTYEGVGWTKEEAEKNALKRAGGKKSDYKVKTEENVGPKPRSLKERRP